MQNQRYPVLIFAQSGRFLAESTTQAGYPVWVTDCFGDQDTLSIAQRWQQLPVITDLSDNNILAIFYELTNDEKCTLICGSGIESCYSILDNLPDNIQLAGNTAHTIHIIKTPRLFFGLLDQLDLTYPETKFEYPKSHENWLIKLAPGLGGGHISYLDKQTNLTAYYFQKFIGGTSGSCLFLANGKLAQIVSINKQNCDTNEYAPFRLSSIETPWSISDQHQQQLEQAIKKLTSAISLVGLNSIDFIISNRNELLILEINPRPSASAELINFDIPLFQYHLNACNGVLPNVSITPSTTKTSLRYLYANKDLIIPADLTWPSECHDLPAADTVIKEHEPICTSIVEANSNQDISNLHQEIENKVIHQLRKLEN